MSMRLRVKVAAFESFSVILKSSWDPLDTPIQSLTCYRETETRGLAASSGIKAFYEQNQSRKQAKTKNNRSE